MNPYVQELQATAKALVASRKGILRYLQQDTSLVLYEKHCYLLETQIADVIYDR